MKFFLNMLLSCLVIYCLGLFIYLRFDATYHANLIANLDGCVQSLIASLVFLVLVFLLVKPSIKISEFIAEYPQENGHEPHLKIKIVNHSLFRAFDLIIFLYRVERTTGTGPNVRLTLLGKIEGSNSSIPYLESALRGSVHETKPHAAQMPIGRITKDELVREVLENEHAYLMMYVKVKHGLSGLQGNFVKKFHNAGCIKKGRYKHGFFTGIE